MDLPDRSRCLDVSRRGARAGAPPRSPIAADAGAIGRPLVIVAAILVALVAACLVDLVGPVKSDIRVFDAAQVARLDTDMWRSYYDRKPAALFLQLAELLRVQFHFPVLRSYVVAGHAARAAFVFKDGARRADYERALPDLRAYFEAIRAISVTPFDVERAARLELEWWIVHRERPRHAPGDLDRAVADAAAALYDVPGARLATYGHERSVAMTIRDSTQATGGVSEADWTAIRGHLDTSWASLAAAVHP